MIKLDEKSIINKPLTKIILITLCSYILYHNNTLGVLSIISFILTLDNLASNCIKISISKVIKSNDGTTSSYVSKTTIKSSTKTKTKTNNLECKGCNQPIVTQLQAHNELTTFAQL